MAGEQGGLLAFLNTPEGQGLLAGAFGGLAGARRGQPLNSIGRAGMAGLQGYTNAQDQEQKLAQDAQRNKMFDLQMQQHQVALGQAQKAQEQAGMRKNYLGGVGKVTSPKVGAAPNQFDPMRWLGMDGSVGEAKDLAGSGNWGKSAIKDYKEVRTPDGVQIVGFDEFGNQRQTGATPYKAPEVRDFGGYVGGIDPITGAVSRYGNKSMSPDAAASNQVAWANVRTAQDRLNFDKQQPKGQYDAERGVLIDPRTGQAKPVTMGGKPLGPKDKASTVTEGERNAGGYLLRMTEATKLLDKFEKTGTASYGSEFAGAVPFVGGMTRRAVMSDDQQQYRQAQEDWVRAKLRKESGASIPPDEMDREIEAYFPMPGEGKKLIAQKRQSRAVANTAMQQSAGRAAAQQNGGASGEWGGGWSIQEVK